MRKHTSGGAGVSQSILFQTVTSQSAPVNKEGYYTPKTSRKLLLDREIGLWIMRCCFMVRD